MTDTPFLAQHAIALVRITRTAFQANSLVRFFLGLLAVCMLLAAPNARADDAQYFTVVAPGVVKDSRTGLEWMRCSVGQDWDQAANTCTGTAKSSNWEPTKDIAKKLNSTGGYAGRTGWRVPTVRELQSLRYCPKGFASDAVNLYDGKDPVPSRCNTNSAGLAIAQTMFPHTPLSFYWTATYDSLHSGVDSTINVYVIIFSNGALVTSDFNSHNVVRFVR